MTHSSFTRKDAALQRITASEERGESTQYRTKEISPGLTHKSNEEENVGAPLTPTSEACFSFSLRARRKDRINLTVSFCVRRFNVCHGVRVRCPRG